MGKHNTKLNIEQGKRLKECLKEKQMSQTELARAAGYTKQYISNLAVGRKNFTIDSARAISKILQVREEYLLCEDSYRTHKELHKKWNQKYETLDDITLQLLALAGYKPICDFIRNWNELDLDKLNIGPLDKINSFIDHIPFSSYKQLDYATEIIAPNGLRFYCDKEDLQLLGYELIEFIHFRMKQLESKFAMRYDDGRVTVKNPDSTFSFYDVVPSEISEHFDLTSKSSRWINHDSVFFPDIDSFSEIQENSD